MIIAPQAPSTIWFKEPYLSRRNFVPLYTMSADRGRSSFLGRDERIRQISPASPNANRGTNGRLPAGKSQGRVALRVTETC